MKSTALTIAALLASLSCAMADATYTDPVVFDPASTAWKFPLERIDYELPLQLFSFSADGHYVAVARTPATIHVWSLKSGQRTLSRSPGSDGSEGHVALAGEPCSAIVGKKSLKRSKVTLLEAYSCETGELLTTISVGQPSDDLLSLTPVQGCGLVLASYEGGGVVVYDTATRKLRADIAKVFAARTPSSKKKTERYDEKAQWVFAASSSRKCAVFGVLLEYRTNVKQLVPTGLYEFDLGTGQMLLARQFIDNRQVAAPITPIGRLMVSPSGDRVAFHFQRVTTVFQNKGPLGSSDLIVFDLKTSLPPKVIDMRGHGSAIRNMAFLNDREIILNSLLVDVGNVVSLFDVESEKSHTLCNSDFTKWKRTGSSNDGPAALGVDATHHVLAVVFEQTLRIYRYRRDPTRTYAGRQLCNVY